MQMMIAAVGALAAVAAAGRAPEPAETPPRIFTTPPSSEPSPPPILRTTPPSELSLPPVVEAMPQSEPPPKEPDCFTFLALFSEAVRMCEGKFMPERDGEAVRACELVYSRLGFTGARLIDPAARTEAVVQGFRGLERLGPLIGRVRARNPAALEEGGAGSGLAAVFSMAIGAAQMDEPETSPHVAEAAALATIADRCDAVLDEWDVPASESLPEDVARLGVAEFRVNGLTAGETFADAATADAARAACEGSPDRVAAAVAAGARLDAEGASGLTPLAWAIACENLTGIAALLDAGADPNQVAAEGTTPVALAAGYRDPRILRLLLERGGSPDAVAEGETALGIAYSMGRHGAGWENYEVLLAAGADVNRAAPSGRTIVDRALTFADYPRVLEFLHQGYRGDLAEIASSLALDDEVDRGPAEARAAVRAWLVERGVEIPPSRRGVEPDQDELEEEE